MKQLILQLILFFHLLLDIFNCIYIFIFPTKYDIYYASWILFVVVHWLLLKRECIISYIEKRILDPNYIFGSNPRYMPYKNAYYDKMHIMLISKIVLINTSLLYIAYRSDNWITKLVAVLACCIYVYVILTNLKIL
jgi:hypothetical protein